MDKLEKIIIKILKVGVISVLFVPLIYSSTTIFPFIFPKSLAFRVLVELLFVPYIYLLLTNPAYRPRRSKLMTAVFIFLGVSFLATIFGIDPIRSFWGNHERMMGWFMYSHVVLFFLITISVFRTKEEWRKFMLYVIGAGIFVTAIGYIQYFSSSFLHETRGGRIFGTFGNSIYFSGYMLFQIHILLWLTLKEKHKGKQVVGFTLLALELAVFSFARTRGATLGLIASVCIIFLFLAWHSLKSRPRLALTLAAAPVLIVATLLFLRSNPAFKSIKLLSPITQFSLKEGTATTRLMNWKVGLKAAMSRPILGWGPENYYYAFNRFYDPRFYEFSAYETWQDHSHNFLIDHLVEEGILGLAAFLSIFGFAVWIFIKMVKKSEDKAAGILFFSAIVGYFVQNLFAFDTLGIWIMIYVILGFAHISAAPTVRSTNIEDVPIFFKLDPTVRIACTLGALLLMFFGVYMINVVPFTVSASTIKAGQIFQNDVQASYNLLISALDKPSPYKGESRDELSKIISTILQGSKNLTYNDASRMMMAMEKEFKKNLDAHPKDTHYNLNYARWALMMATYLDPSYYLDAEEALKNAKDSSPSRQQVWFSLLRFYGLRNHQDQAVEAGRKVVDLWDRVPESHWRYGEALIYAGKEKEGFEEQKGALYYKFGTPFTHWSPQELELYIQVAEKLGYKNEALWWRGILLNSSNDTKGAYENMKKAADAGYRDIMAEHLVIYFGASRSAGQPISDIKFFNDILEKYPGHREILFAIYSVMYNGSDKEKARELFITLAKEAPAYIPRVARLIGVDQDALR